jgi:hypothetical protein
MYWRVLELSKTAYTPGDGGNCDSSPFSITGTRGASLKLGNWVAAWAG